MKKLIISIIFFVILFYTVNYSYAQIDLPQKGLAMSYPNQNDIANLGNIWYHVWGTCPEKETKCVPMSWCGEDPNLPINYSGYVILFNEPESETQCNITPERGIDYYMILQSKYPHVKWVVGNSIFWGEWKTWLIDFKTICENTKNCISPAIWGVHVYIKCGAGYEYSHCRNFIKRELESLHSFIGGIFWVTEFADIGGNIVSDNMILNLFEGIPWITRWAYFTNRSNLTDPWILDGWKVDLFDLNTGEPTDIGNWYIEYNFYKTRLPLLIKN